MKVSNNFMDMFSGEVKSEEQKVKTKHFTTLEGNSYFREFLIEKHIPSEAIGQRVINKKKFGNLTYLTLYGKTVEVRFLIWQAVKDTKGGKANLFIGEKWRDGLTDSDGTKVGDRFITNQIDLYALLVVPKDFKEGNKLSDVAFYEWLLVTQSEMIEMAKSADGFGGCFYVRQEDRMKYSFDTKIKEIQ